MSTDRVRLRRPLAEPLVELIAMRLSLFAQPLRIRLVDRLESGEATVQELAAAVGAGQQNVSKHLAILHRAGTVARRRDGAYVRYSLVDVDALPLLEQAAVGLARQLRQRARLIEPS
ncbi:MAG TPA: metalloregulator ArsR/SmtB family transcription factor [Gaiellaceae bacterium]|jgi:DNA-binding transcriptional ArsR family regulator